MKKLIFTIISITLINSVFAQQYSRLSLTPLHIKHKSGGLSLVSMSDSVNIGDKYDYNFYGNNRLSVPFERVSPFQDVVTNLANRISELYKNSPTSTDQIKQLNKQLDEANEKLKYDDSIRMPLIIQAIANEKIANKILSSILIDPSLGYMTTDVIAKRAEYNASDADVMKAMNSETKMAAIRDKGLDLLKNVYIIIFDDLSQSESAIDKENPQNKTIGVTSKAYLFQIDIDSLMKTGQFDPLIFTETDLGKANAFKNFNFPVKYIMNTVVTGATSNYEIDPASVSTKGLLKSALSNGANATPTIKYIIRSDDKIGKDLVNSLFSSSEIKFTKKYKPFQVKINVFANNPISAKIGKKEALKVDELYKVTETVLLKNGEKKDRKIGWVRVKKVADNKKNADGKTEPSTFYKVSSKKVERGMKMTNKPEIGTVFGLAYGIGEENVAAGPMVTVDYISHISPGARVGISIGGFGKLKPKEVQVAGIATDALKFEGTNIYADVTVQKILQKNHLELTPQFGGYFNMLSINKLNDADVPESLKGLANTTYGLLAGVKLGFNFGPHTQLNVGYKYGFQIGSSLKSDAGDVTLDGTTATPITMDFNAPSVLTLGLRLFGL